MKHSFKSVGITPESTDAERYQVLKGLSVVPAQVDHDALRNAGADLEQFKTTKTSAVERPMRELAEKLVLFDVDYHNSHIDFPFQFYRDKGLHTSLPHQRDFGGSYEDYAKALSCFGKLVENAVPVETHYDYKKGTPKEEAGLKQVYVRVSASESNTGVLPGLLEVREFSDSTKSSLYVAVSLQEIERSRVFAHIPSGKSAGQSYTLPASTIRLADLLSNVNREDGRQLKYIPDGFLNDSQKDTKRSALDDQKVYVKKERAKPPPPASPRLRRHRH